MIYNNQNYRQVLYASAQQITAPVNLLRNIVLSLVIPPPTSKIGFPLALTSMDVTADFDFTVSTLFVAGPSGGGSTSTCTFRIWNACSGPAVLDGVNFFTQTINNPLGTKLAFDFSDFAYGNYMSRIAGSMGELASGNYQFGPYLNLSIERNAVISDEVAAVSSYRLDYRGYQSNGTL